jgi:hypothetical protein
MRAMHAGHVCSKRRVIGVPAVPARHLYRAVALDAVRRVLQGPVREPHRPLGVRQLCGRHLFAGAGRCRMRRVLAGHLCVPPHAAGLQSLSSGHDRTQQWDAGTCHMRQRLQEKMCENIFSPPLFFVFFFYSTAMHRLPAGHVPVHGWFDRMSVLQTWCIPESQRGCRCV